MIKRNPQTGDVISIGRKSDLLLVVEAEQLTYRDQLRGDVYHAFVFKTIARDDEMIVNPKIKTWTVMENSSFTEGKPVSLNEITLHDHVRVKRRDVIVYEVVSKRK